MTKPKPQLPSPYIVEPPYNPANLDEHDDRL